MYKRQVQYCEKKYPELLPFVSTSRSPMQMFASVIKENAKTYSQKHFHVAVMPCTAKKFEAARDEFKTKGMPNVDAVITTQEFIRMIKMCIRDSRRHSASRNASAA